MTPMRVLQIMAGAEMGGAEAFFERLCRALHGAGVDQRLAIRTNPTRSSLLRGAGLVVDEFPFGGLLDITTGRALNRLAADYRPDVALAWMNRAAARMPSGPFIKVARLGGYYDLKYYKRCDYLVGNTPDICRYLKDQGWPEERTAYLPNFVDADRMPPADRRQFDTPAEVPLLLCLGRLHRNKGFDTALTALADIPDAYLWIAGEGSERAALERLAGALGVAERVRFLGWRTDVPALLATADIFLCSSRHEPLGNMVIEAWAHSTPVAACASQGPAQLITDGEDGLLCPVEDAPALAGLANTLIDDPAAAQTLAVAGAETFRRNYAEGPVVQRYLDFFETVVRDGNA